MSTLDASTRDDRYDATKQQGNQVHACSYHIDRTHKTWTYGHMHTHSAQIDKMLI
jgi:hypothetical protein